MVLSCGNLLRILSVSLISITALNLDYNKFRQRQLIVSTLRSNGEEVECPKRFTGAICVGHGIYIVCIRGDLILQIPCHEFDPQLNSCKDGKCSAGSTISKSNFVLPTNLTCHETGYYPDIKDCHRYYDCFNNTNAVSRDCPSNKVYEPKTGNCAFGPCYHVDCSKFPGQILPYPTDPSYYIDCTKNETELPMRCSDPKNMVYDDKTGKCTFKCQREGRFPDVSNCKQYYECYLVKCDYESRLESCECGQGFNATIQQCVIDPNCK